MSTWILKVGAVTKSLAAWGINADSVSLVRKSFDADELSWAMSTADVLAEPPFVFGDAVTLYKDGAVKFTGWVRDESFEGSAESEVQKFIAKNAWHELEVIVYEQERVTKSADDNFGSELRARASKIMLGFRIDTGKIDNKNQMEDLLDDAIAAGVELQHDVDFSGLTPPYEERKDITIAGAMRAMASLTPDCFTWFDYSTTPPTLFVRRRATETPLSIDLLGGAPLVQFRPLKALYDLQPVGVDLTVVTGATNPADGKRYAVLNRIQAGIVALRARMVRATIDLAGDGTLDEEATPEELAAQYYAATRELFYDCGLIFVGSEVTYRPGNMLNFTNGRVVWATAKAIVQSVTETPAREMQVVECGRPPMLQGGTWAEISRRFVTARDTGLLGTFYSGYTQEPTAPDVFGPRTLVVQATGYDNGSTPGYSFSMTFVVEIQSRVSCRVKVTAWSGYYLSPATPFTVLFFWSLYDQTGNSYLALGLDTWSTPIPTGTYGVNLVFESVFPHNGVYNNPGASNTDWVGQLDCNP